MTVPLTCARSWRPWAILAALAGGGLLATAGCPSASPPGNGDKETRVLVGKVEGTGALIGMVTDGAEAVAYVCDGVEGITSISGWYAGAVQDGAFELTPVSGTGYEGTGADRRITGAAAGEALEGHYVLGDGTTHAWRAEPADRQTAAGLYVSDQEDQLAGVVVTNDGEAIGLSRSKVTGWTTRVELPGTLTKADTLDVLVAAQPVKVSIIQAVPVVKERIVPKLDPLPTLGDGTLMVMVIVKDDKAIGYRYVQQRPDRIGLPTIEWTRLLRSNPPARVLHTGMRVQVVDAGGGVLSGQFIDDPLGRRYEVPGGPKGENPFWIDVKRDVTSFLVAVPNIRGARHLVFTRFDIADRPIDAGAVDLLAPPIPRGKEARRLQAVGYDAANAEHATVLSNGPPQERFDLLIIAEGFRDTNADRLAFDQGVQNLLNFMWTIPIYAEFQQAINVHTAYLPSVGAGADHPEDNPPLEVDTPFGAYFNCSNIERLLCLSVEGEALVYEVAGASPGNYGEGSVDAIMVLVNDPEYGGAGGALLTASLDADSPEIATHEFGHSVIGLGDEYESEYPALVEYARTKVNVSGTIVNRNDLKWIDLVDPSTDIPTEVDPGTCVTTVDCPPPLSTLPPGTVGMYEGAGYVACGSYRPTTYCHMRCYVQTFCPVCERAFRTVLGPFQPPTVDMYMRDNSLDIGAVPSPMNVEEPPGSGQRVKPYHSVDIRVDAPPFSNFSGLDVVHENPVAGVLNRVWIIVHNRGTAPAGEFADVNAYFAPATGGAPPFSGGSWTSMGAVGTTIPGGSSFPMLINWNVPPSLAGHTCVIATVDAPSDPLPPLIGGLTLMVRYSNNITWKNLHIVTVPEIVGEISNYERQVQPTVFRIEAAGVPVGTEFNLGHDDTIAMIEFEPGDVRQMDLLSAGEAAFSFRRAGAEQEWFSLRVDLPPGDEKEPFRANFVLKVQLPGGTPPDNAYLIDISQIAVDPQTGILGEVIGGNQYEVSF